MLVCPLTRFSFALLGSSYPKKTKHSLLFFLVGGASSCVPVGFNFTVRLGIRGPRPARFGDRGNKGAPVEKAEPYGQESLDYSVRKFMQRDVEVEFDSTDKAGGFIGALYINKTENAAIDLVREGNCGPPLVCTTL